MQQEMARGHEVSIMPHSGLMPPKKEVGVFQQEWEKKPLYMN